jgi:hyperosmotically inducible periplasmic protein
MFTGVKIKALILSASLAVLLTGFAGIGWASIPKQSASLTDRVRHELLMLPRYGVFDALSFSIDSSNTVTLAGEVMHPILRSDAEATVRNIQGVGRVINNIEVLPLSPFDNSIRLATYRAIFARQGLEKYAIRGNLPIRIIVRNGNVTLEGFVDNALDRQLIEMAARLVPNVFSVTDNLGIS